MSVTYVVFQPNNVEPFQFGAVLDGLTYNVICTWGVFYPRYFISIYSSSGERILTTAMVSSPKGYDISLTAGYFTTKLVWRGDNNQFEVISP